MATLLETIVFGIVQGLTEWLPISSSGHFAVAQHLMKVHVPVFVDVCLHLGTLLSALLFFRQDVVGIVKAIARSDFRSPEGRVAVNILIGGLPTIVIGLLLRGVIEDLFTNLLVVGGGLAVTGLFLYFAKMEKGKGGLSLGSCAIIGFAQGVAVIPGLSRSGLTISVGVLLGIERELAFRYSFLLSMPTILGATLINMGDIETYSLDGGLLMVGFGVSAVLGYLSLKALRRIYRWNGGFILFASYCWLVSVLAVMASLIV